MKEYFDEFDKIVKQIETVISFCEQQCSPLPNVTTKPTKEKLAYIHLYNDIKELSYWFTLVFNEQTLQYAHAKSYEPEAFSKNSELLFQWTNVHSQFNTKNRLYLKSIYTWLYHISEDIKLSDNLKDGKHDKIKSELGIHCLFRHNMMTHKTSFESFPLNYYFPSGDLEEFRILMVPYAFRPEINFEFNSLLSECGISISDLSGTGNTLAKLKSLMEMRRKINGGLSRKVNTFLAKHGMCSETPLILAEFASRLTKETLQELCIEIKQAGEC